ncbi:MAG TPA: hypothetical protein VLW53_11500, partial [Candidatus Eisenbacteria bacterium]|nr:hypothetical protein [Candidatus Eisenbacteria bacterium]
LPATVVLVLRSDFYGQFGTRAARLLQRLEDGVLVNMPARLDPPELREIAERPAERLGLRFERGLVDDIVRDTLEAETSAEGDRFARSAALPLLEFTLTQLWLRRDGASLTHAAYAECGGVTGGLALWANRAYHALDPELRPAAQRVLTGLVHLGDEREGRPDSRRSRPLADLLDDDAGPERALAVARRLADERLVVTSRDPRNGAETVELIHDALLWEWEPLKQWLDRDRRFLQWRQACEPRARAWIDSGPDGRRDAGRLLADSDLQEAAAWREARPRQLSPALAGFLGASGARQARRALGARLVRAGAVLAAVAIAGTGLLAEQALQQRNLVDQQRQLALEQRHLADSRQVATEAAVLHARRPDLAMPLSLEAMRISPTLEARSSVLSEQSQRYAGTLVRSQGASSMAVSPGRPLLAVVVSGRVQLWDLSRRALLGTVGDEGPLVDELAVSPDGRVVAVGTAREIQFWSAESGFRKLGTIAGGSGLRGLAFSPDGSIVAGIDTSGVQLWDARTRALTASVPAPGVLDIAFSPDGSLLGGESHDAVQVWDTHHGYAQMATFPANDDPIFSAAIAFSPQGDVVAAASAGNTATLWRLQDRARVATITAHGSDVNAIAFDPDGSTVATADQDGAVILSQAAAGVPLARVAQLTGGVRDIAFGPDGLLVTFSFDDAVRLWETRGHVFNSLAGPVRKVAFSPDGRTLATAVGPGGVELWDTHTGRRSLVPTAAGDPVQALAFSPDGKTLATTGFAPSGRTADQHVVVWEVASGRRLATLAPNDADFYRSVAFSVDGRTLATSGLGGPIDLWRVGTWERDTQLKGADIDLIGGYEVTFSPDGRFLVAAAGGGHALLLWDARTHARVTSVQRPDPPRGASDGGINQVAVAPDGHTVATSFQDGTIGLWDIGQRRYLGTFGQPSAGGHTGRINDLTFSPDGGTLATAGASDSAVKLWDVRRRILLGTLSGHSNGVDGVAFGSNGTLASGGADGVTVLWDTDVHRVARTICERVTPDLTSSDWTPYIPSGEPRQRGCTG